MAVLNAAPPLAGLSADSQHAAAIAQTQSEDARWNQWKAKGRAEDVRSRRRLKTVVVDLAAVTAFVAAVWFAFQF